MADDNSTASSKKEALPAYYVFVNSLLNLRAAIRLSRTAVYGEMGMNEELVSAEGVLTLAEAELERICAVLESTSIRDVWPTPTPVEKEVAHG